MKCLLCRNEKDKLCRAHVIPKAFFRFMYPDSKISDNGSLVILKEDKDYTNNSRTGIIDENILCEECDNFLGREYDNYGKDIFIDLEPQKIRDVDKGSTYEFVNCDNNKLKLFILSLLWRMSISKNEIFSNKKLPDKIENKLRLMLLNNDSGSVHDFSVVLTRFSFHNKTEDLKKYLQIPEAIRIDGLRFWIIYLSNGYKIYVKTDSQKQTDSLLPLTLCYSKNCYVLSFEDFEKSHEFKKLVSNVHKIRINKK